MELCGGNGLFLYYAQFLFLHVLLVQRLIGLKGIPDHLVQNRKIGGDAVYLL